MAVTEPSKTPYLHVREAEAVLFPFAVEIIGNAKALLQLRKQIDRALEGRDTFPFDETLYRELAGDAYEVVKLARSPEEMRRLVPRREASDPERPLALGDEVEPGTQGAAENACPDCSGSGRPDNGEDCPNCNGRGLVIRAVGSGGQGG